MEKGEVHTGFWWGHLRERDNLEGLGMDGRMILKLILKKWDGSMNLIVLAQNRGMWLAFVNASGSIKVVQFLD
jgi:hypothetical protein